MFHPSGSCWALVPFCSQSQGFHTETQGYCTFAPGFGVGLAVLTRCLFLRPLLDGACPPSSHTRSVLRALGQSSQMVCGSFSTYILVTPLCVTWQISWPFCPATKVYQHPFLQCRATFCTTVQQLGRPSFSDGLPLPDQVGCSSGRGQVPSQDPFLGPLGPFGPPPFQDRLVSLVVKACDGIFPWSSHANDLRIDTPVATLPGAWRYRVRAWTGWPSVSIL